ncbi:protoporphyrinogen oxidase [Leptospira fluminis]|uniref:Coproporphyrinogen III oxidase n=1 Tax=Leptospira fluminis TaxID=2484979 RepID=A0A4R9GRJ3_9LEPT|nr:protoporphyrinogen oxidase [Leptospira fluminis]TGK20169.1 protoporphyrinogen oxidase [Leptospira fluminis]
MAKQIPDQVVIGAGFTGLVHAFLALEKGESVLVLEKKDSTGGLIHSVRTEYGIVETAANGILNSWQLEKLAARLGLDLLFPDSAARKRFIFANGKPRRMPLSFPEILRMLYGSFSKPSKPEPGESVLHWGKRVLGEAAVAKLLEPALGGIYAGDLDAMSAEFVFGKFLLQDQTLWKNMMAYSKSMKLQPKVLPGRKGTVSFRGGIGTLIGALEARVTQDGEIRYDEDVTNLRDLRKKFPGSKITIATGLNSSLRILKGEFPELKSYHGVLELLPVVSVTRFGKDSVLQGKKGFGILFPKDHKTFSSELGVRVRGILLNDFIFPSRSEKGIHSETYIYGGAGDREIATRSEDDIIGIVEEDRKKLLPESSDPLNHYVTVWKEAIPVYGPQLYSFNRELDRLLPPEIKVEGNFRQGIGLKSILERAYAVT